MANNKVNGKIARTLMTLTQKGDLCGNIWLEGQNKHDMNVAHKIYIKAYYVPFLAIGDDIEITYNNKFADIEVPQAFDTMYASPVGKMFINAVNTLRNSVAYANNANTVEISKEEADDIKKTYIKQHFEAMDLALEVAEGLSKSKMAKKLLENLELPKTKQEFDPMAFLSSQSNRTLSAFDKSFSVRVEG